MQQIAFVFEICVICNAAFSFRTEMNYLSYLFVVIFYRYTTVHRQVLVEVFTSQCYTGTQYVMCVLLTILFVIALLKSSGNCIYRVCVHF